MWNKMGFIFKGLSVVKKKKKKKLQLVDQNGYKFGTLEDQIW